MGPEWLIPLVIIVVLFGGSQIPKLARSLGSAQREFKQGLAEGEKGDQAEQGEKSDEGDGKKR